MVDDGIKCTFCRIYNNSELVYENEHFFANFDAFPVTPGHIEIIPKRHVASLFDLTNEEWARLQGTIGDIVELIESTDLNALYQGKVDNPLNDISVQYCQDALDSGFTNRKPDAYNLGINEGTAAGRTIDHLHLHIIPRYVGDVEDPVGGVRHMIPGKGNYKK